MLSSQPNWELIVYLWFAEQIYTIAMVRLVKIFVCNQISGEMSGCKIIVLEQISLHRVRHKDEREMITFPPVV